MQQNNRVISFLMRLDKKYSQVQSNMLMMVELPTSAQAYRILLQEETHLDLSTTKKKWFYGLQGWEKEVSRKDLKEWLWQ